MTLDYDIQRCSRRCCATDRELVAGETVFSALVPEGSQTVRRDWSASAWSGPPQDALSWWKSTIPETGPKRPQMAPIETLRECFERLEGIPDQADFRYVLTLLLARRKILRTLEVERDDQGRETLVVECPKTDQQWRVPAIVPDARRARQIQVELSRILFPTSAPQGDAAAQDPRPGATP